jgi:hypothetical protein
VAIKSILENLNITKDNITFVRAELTRPEIRILRLTMLHCLELDHDLIPIIEQQVTHSKDIAPMLNYLGQRNATLQVMKNVSKSHGTPGAEYNPWSSMILCYHTNTGNYAKGGQSKPLPVGSFPSFPVQWCWVRPKLELDLKDCSHGTSRPIKYLSDDGPLWPRWKTWPGNSFHGEETKKWKEFNRRFRKFEGAK